MGIKLPLERYFIIHSFQEEGHSTWVWVVRRQREEGKRRERALTVVSVGGMSEAG